MSSSGQPFDHGVVDTRQINPIRDAVLYDLRDREFAARVVGHVVVKSRMITADILAIKTHAIRNDGMEVMMAKDQRVLEPVVVSPVTLMRLLRK